jgi:hypothetical protein
LSEHVVVWLGGDRRWLGGLLGFWILVTNAPFNAMADGLKSNANLLTKIIQQRAGVALRVAGHFQV